MALAGAIAAVQPLTRREDGSGDLLAPSDRGLGALLLMGITPLEIFRNHLGRAESRTGGWTGGLHLTALDRGVLAPLGPPGTEVAVIAGAALSHRLRGTGRIGMSFSPMAATATGAWHEGAAVAAAQRCPVVLVVEPGSDRDRTGDGPILRGFVARARGYGIVGESVTANDLLAVRGAAARAVEAVRSDGRPRLLELRESHDDAADPMGVLRSGLVARGLVGEPEAEEIAERARELAREAEERALAEPTPDPAVSFRTSTRTGSGASGFREVRA